MFTRISDPFGRGCDLFGIADYVLAVAAAHDVAISRWKHTLAVRSQYPMLGVMILYTVLGLFLLLGA